MRSLNSALLRRASCGAARALMTAWLSAILAFACAADGGRSTGGETHFLSLCVESESCGDGLSCICGVCTAPCSNDDGCRALPEAECVAAVPADSCASAPARSCDVQCLDNADCSSVSASHRCESGLCRIPSGVTPEPDEQDSGVDAPDAATSDPDSGMMSDAATMDSSTSQADASDAGMAESGSLVDAEPLLCSTPAPAANEVVILGDSFFASENAIAPQLETLAREAGVLSAQEGYRDHSRLVNNALALMNEGIAAQYEEALSGGPLRAVIMNGGGADALVGPCDDATAPCPLLTDAENAAARLLARMSDDGIERVVYVFYPDPIEENVRRKVDGLRPLIQAVCDSSPVPCAWLDLRPVFEGRYDEYIAGDGLNPTALGAEATAREIWAVMQQQCIAQ